MKPCPYSTKILTFSIIFNASVESFLPQENRSNWMRYVHEEFDKYRSVPRRDFATIEHLLRLGNRRYEMYKSPLIKNVH